MTEIATLYLALHRGVVVADVLFNRGEKKAKRTQAGLPLEAFLESEEKNSDPLFLSESGSELKGSVFKKHEQQSRAVPNSCMVLKGKKIINEFLRYFLRPMNCLKSFLQAYK